MNMHALAREHPSMSGRHRYSPPNIVHQTTLTAALAAIGRPPIDGGQTSFLEQGQSKADTHLFYAGDLHVLSGLSVAVVGARSVSSAGAKRARRLAGELADAGITVVSGLAKGVDVNAHRAAIATGGKTAAVIGTPLAQAYPAENAALQEDIARDFLVLTPFAEGTRVFQSNFPKRNRVMAALSHGSVIIEASDSSGTLHQAVECERLGRWLFILRSVVDDGSLEWPKRFLKYKKALIVDSTADVVDALAQG